MSEKRNTKDYQEESKRENAIRDKKIAVNDNIKYVSNVDYTLKFDYVIKGKVQKNDIIGSIYNHGAQIMDDLTLEKLQQKRKLGRFNINLVYTDEGTVGDLTIPLIADKLEASIVAANIETIEKCGPFPHKIKLSEIINEKEQTINKVLSRAKQIFETKFKGALQSISQLRALLKSSTSYEQSKYVLLDAAANIYGGPYHSKNEIYLVEGLNDVKKLIDYKIYNTISVNGGEYDIEALRRVVADKEITVLFDADRGGLLLSEQIAPAINAAYIVNLPTGCCVESIEQNVLFDAIYKNKTIYSHDKV